MSSESYLLPEILNASLIRSQLLSNAITTSTSQEVEKHLPPFSSLPRLRFVLLALSCLFFLLNHSTICSLEFDANLPCKADRRLKIRKKNKQKLQKSKDCETADAALQHSYAQLQQVQAD